MARGSPQGDELSVFTFNVLSQREIERYKVYCKLDYLQQEYRRGLIFNEVKFRGADIVCLQELDHSEYKEHYVDNLGQEGYDSVYYPSGRFKNYQKGVDNTNSHGCAIFFKKSKYQRMLVEYVEYNKLFKNIRPMVFNQELENHFMRLYNVGIVLILKNELNEPFIIANTHIYWHPKYESVKVIQSKILLEKIQLLYDKMRFKKDHVPLVITGDFNSTPSSGVYEFYSRGKLHYSHKSIVHSDLPCFREEINHSFSLQSSYKETIGEPEFTNFTDGFKDTLDYIWYSTHSLQPIYCKPLINKSEASLETALPNSKFPSDHLPLFTKFKFKKS